MFGKLRIVLLCAAVALTPVAYGVECDRISAAKWVQKAAKIGKADERAVFYLRKAVEACSVNTVHRRVLAMGLRELERYSEAETEIEQALKIDPYDPHTLREYGHILYDQKRYSSALIQLQKMLEYSDDPVTKFKAHWSLAWTYRELGNDEEKLNHWIKADNYDGPKLYKDKRALHRYISWGYATCPTKNFCDGNMAVNYYKKIPKVDLKWSELGTGAAAYARNGDFKTAIRLQEDSILAMQNSKTNIKSKWRDDAWKRMKLYEQGKPFTAE